MRITDLKQYSVIAPASDPILQQSVQKQSFDPLNNPVTRGIQAIFPGQKVGQAIGTLAGFAKSKIDGTSESYDTSAPSPMQVGGDIVAGALNVAGFKGAGTTGTLTQRILKMAGMGAGMAGGSAVAEGEGAGDVAKSTTGGAVLGAALPVVGAGLRAMGRQIEGLPDRFLNSALGRSKDQIIKDIASGSEETLNKYIIESKPIGSADSLLKGSTEAVTTLGEQIQTKLSNSVRTSGQKVTIGRDNFLDEIAATPEAKGALMGRSDVLEIVQRLAPQTKSLLQKPSLNLEDANRLRQLLDSTLGDRAFLGGQLTNDKTILKAFADRLRETVKTKAPDEVRELFQELTHEIRLRDALLDRIAQKSKNQVLSIGDIFGGGIGAVVGGGIPGAAAGVAARRTLESVPFKVGMAKFTDALTKAEPVLEGLAPAQQVLILNLFSSLFGDAENSQSPSQ